jgi:hypothetical protein
MNYGPAMKRTVQMGMLVFGGLAIALSLGSAQSGCSSSSGTGTAGTSGTAGTTGSAGTTGDAGASGDAGTGGGDAGTGGSTAGTGGATAGTGGSTVACRNDGIQITADITTDTTWACNSYRLMQKIHIDGGSTVATLTIAPGSKIYGEGSPTSPAALISTRNGRLNAVGTPTAPITFTSSALVGSRMPGDTFAGVVMLGKAGINSGTCVNGTGTCAAPGYFQRVIEGLDANDPKGQYGGTDDAWNCGDLRYVRIQFAGYIIGANNELNGLTLGGCGSGTRLSYIQIQRGLDDGIEFFGGTASADHVIIAGVDDDGLDWDFGWTGKVQHLIVHQAYGTGDRAFEADNFVDTESVTPRSNPEIWNATIIGQSGLAAGKLAMHLRRGTWYKLRNFIVYGFGLGAVDVEAAVGVAGNTNNPNTDWPINMSIESSVFYGGPISPTEPMEACTPTTCASGNDDFGFDETASVTAAARMNTTDMDPMFPAALTGAVISNPSYVPGNAAAVNGKATPPAPLDTTATYAGAVAPGTAAGAAWYDGWTEFPEK